MPDCYYQELPVTGSAVTHFRAERRLRASRVSSAAGASGTHIGRFWFCSSLSPSRESGLCPITALSPARRTLRLGWTVVVRIMEGLWTEEACLPGRRVCRWRSGRVGWPLARRVADACVNHQATQLHMPMTDSAGSRSSLGQNSPLDTPSSMSSSVWARTSGRAFRLPGGGFVGGAASVRSRTRKRSGAPARCSTSARTTACGFSTELRLVRSRI